MLTTVVSPSLPSGQGRRIELAGIDLCLIARIDNVFVYPSMLDIDRFKSALSRALSLFPCVAGRLLVLQQHYFIEMVDNSIPITYVENTDLGKWPGGNDVVIDLKQNLLAGFVDEVETSKIILGSNNEPLVRFKITNIVQSGECILGSSWGHVLGDAAANMMFLNTISRYYQNLEPLYKSPILERRLWSLDEGDLSLLETMKSLRDAQTLAATMETFIKNQSMYEQLNLHFSGQQIRTLYDLVNDSSLTVHDVLCAYLIVTLNQTCYLNDNERLIRRSNIILNIRGIHDSIASTEQISNAVIPIISDDFPDPCSMKSVASTIRRCVTESRDPAAITIRTATCDQISRKLVEQNLLPNMKLYSNEMIINSNFRYDWAAMVDFGYKDQCRFYTAWTDRLYFRIFRLNPIKIDDTWQLRDHHGAEVAFKLEQQTKEKFLYRLHQDISENFLNVPK